jgi:peptide/nickel transport system permease protein
VNQGKQIWTSLILLGAIHVVALLAGFFAPYDFATQHRELPFVPPTRLHLIDSQGQLHARPFVYRWVARPEGFAAYDEDRTRAFSVRFFVRGSRYQVVGIFYSSWHLFGVEEPAHVFLAGSDDYGRDQFSRLLYGGQVSLFAGLAAAGISLVLAVVLGGISGFYAGQIDEFIMRFAELFLALPWLYLLFAVRAFLPLHITPTQAFFLIVMVIGVIGWARPARLVRGIALTARERRYVLAARGFGASDLYLLRRHVLPETYGVLLTQAALLIPQYILAEVTLSFLGLGIGAPVPSWGNMLASLQNYSVLTSYSWMFTPGLVLIPVFLLYYKLSNALQERIRFVRI